jgi:hypothetical protein
LHHCNLSTESKSLLLEPAGEILLTFSQNVQGKDYDEGVFYNTNILNTK